MISTQKPFNLGKIVALPLIIFLLTIFIFGCFSSPSKRYFQINIKTQDVKNIKQRKAIFLKDINVNEFYDDYRLVYRKSPYELNYYAYEFWTIKPGKLIKKAILDYQKNSADYKLIGELSDHKPDYYIEAVLNSLEEIEKKVRYGRLSMEFVLYSFKSGKKLLTYSFDQKERFAEKKIDYFPKVISKILKENIDVFINKIKKMEEENDKKS